MMKKKILKVLQRRKKKKDLTYTQYPSFPCVPDKSGRDCRARKQTIYVLCTNTNCQLLYLKPRVRERERQRANIHPRFGPQNRRPPFQESEPRPRKGGKGVQCQCHKQLFCTHEDFLFLLFFFQFFHFHPSNVTL